YAPAKVDKTGALVRYPGCYFRVEDVPANELCSWLQHISDHFDDVLIKKIRPNRKALLSYLFMLTGTEPDSPLPSLDKGQLLNELADLHEFLGYPMDKYRTVSVERMVEVATFRLAKDFEAPGSEFYPGELAEAEA
ncbi:unnamed protein product, partial [Cladocopium goreaui]